ncbi:MAG: hypothetical protein AB9882_02615 [Ignavibacteriaceae bacterium]
MNLLKKAWKFLEGNKRRIALLGAFIAQATPEYTLAYQIGQGIFLLFASSDLLQLTVKNINKLKEGK